MTKRRFAAVIAILALITIGMWLWRGHTSSEASSAAGRAEQRLGSTAVAATGRRKLDPRSQTRGSISGSVHDAAGAVIAGATVCAETESMSLPSALHQPICTHSDAEGHYQIANLLAAEYVVHAGARQYQFETYYPDGAPSGANRKTAAFPLAAGQARTGVDFVLSHPGVEVTGTVLDLTGGPIAHAQVRGSARRQAYYGPVVETDAQGKFSLWLERGMITVHAVADGYAANETWGRAPGNVEILLSPEATLAGSVIDAGTGQPASGARVEIEDADGTDTASDITDEHGAFRVGGLVAGRHTATAFTDQGYGKTEGSVLLGLGQHVEGVVIKLFPAHRISGAILIGDTDKPCPIGAVELRDQDHGRYAKLRSERGEQVAEGVRPGSYGVEVSCDGYLARDHYDRITVATADVTGLVWRVDPGATIRGKVLSKSGEPIPDADVWSRAEGNGARSSRSWSSDVSKPDGSYQLTGLAAGTQRVNVETDRAVAPISGTAVTVATGATVAQDIVLDDGGALIGTVVDDTGAPVAGVQIIPRGSDGSIRVGGSSNLKSAADGTFRIDTMRPGDYRIVAQRTWTETLRKPGTTDDTKQGEPVTIRAGQTATVRLVIEGLHGTITGSVIDGAGQPIGDAFVSWARESDAAGATPSANSTRSWWNEERPVVTATDGRFTLTSLAPGAYTIRAYRKGGGEAFAEHVAVGGTATLQIKPTGAIAGTAHRDGGPPDELFVMLRDRKTGLSRDETFYMTSGQFSIHDLPAGHFDIAIEGDRSHQSVVVDLAEGEARTGVDVTLDALIDVTGRLVDHTTRQPVPGIYLFAGSAGSNRPTSRGDEANRNVSDAAGRFLVLGVPPGQLAISGYPEDFQNSDYGYFSVARTATGSGTVDVGDIEVIRKRVKAGDKVGELGLHFAQQSSDAQPDERQLKISWIDPAGPAARTALQLGDVIISVDGVDVSGANFRQFPTLTRAPPGTTLAIATQRGVTVQLVLAAP